ncbi:hypothetical protein [Alloyangia pacifica]|uniref:hypothetical protein n=1 Tax=Alloyangia pacifica TaxID=311180 RepID=UPI0031DC9B14
MTALRPYTRFSFDILEIGRQVIRGIDRAPDEAVLLRVTAAESIETRTKSELATTAEDTCLDGYDQAAPIVLKGTLDEAPNVSAP